EKLAMQRAAHEGKQIFHVRVQVDPGCAMPIAARQLVLKALGEAGEGLGSRPDTASVEAARQIHVLVASDKTAQVLTTKCQIPTITSRAQVDAIAPPTQEGAEIEAASAQTAAQARAVPVEPVASAHDEEGPGKSSSAHAENILRVDAE